jgi:hypothetical protein
LRRQHARTRSFGRHPGRSSVRTGNKRIRNRPSSTGFSLGGCTSSWLASDAFIVAPGGNRHRSGTDDDPAAVPEAPSSRHTADPGGKNVARLTEWARSTMLSVDSPLASLEDMAIPCCVANADEAIALIREDQQSSSIGKAGRRTHVDRG